MEMSNKKQKAVSMVSCELLAATLVIEVATYINSKLEKI